MQPHFSENDKIMFYKYLNQCSYYFEFGSGGSTYQASLRDNIKSIFSVESDLNWFKNLIKILKNSNKINIIYNHLNTQKNTWGNPGPNCTDIQKISYSNHINNLDRDIKEKLDFILIDGRFRVACCLKCHQNINDDCLIAFDDFLNRPQYHIILQFFNIIDKTIDNRMVILKKKKDVIIPDELIKTYELIQT